MSDENIVKKACEELGITQKELAERMGVSQLCPRAGHSWSRGPFKYLKNSVAEA
ncbi:MAG: helix-turn-helix domain-containing protein [Wolinella sp.]